MSTGQSSKRSAAGRSSRAYRTAKAAMKAERVQPCWWCHGEIDYDAKPQTPLSFEPDHVVPVSKDITLADDPNNLIQSHSICNRQRGNGDNASAAFIPVTNTSREW